MKQVMLRMLAVVLTVIMGLSLMGTAFATQAATPQTPAMETGVSNQTVPPPLGEVPVKKPTTPSGELSQPSAVKGSDALASQDSGDLKQGSGEMKEAAEPQTQPSGEQTQGETTTHDADIEQAQEEPTLSDAAVEAVISTLQALPAPEGAELGALATRVNAASSALAALTAAQRSQIPADLVAKLDALKALLNGGESELMAWQGDKVSVSVKFVSVPTADRKQCSFGVTLDGQTTDNSPAGFSDSVTLDEANKWKHTFDPVNGAEPHVVSVTSKNTPVGYTATLKGQKGLNAVITVEPVKPSQMLKAKIVWQDCKKAKDQVTVRLTKGSSMYKYAIGADGKAHKLEERLEGEIYSLESDTIDGYEYKVSFSSASNLYTVTYTKEQPTLTYSGTLAWKPSEPAGRKDIKVTLVRTNDGLVMGTAILVDGDNEFYFANVPKYMEDGSRCVYGVRASDVAGYTKATDTKSDQSVIRYYADSDSRVNLRVSASWYDGNDRRGRRPEEVTVYLYADGQPYPSESYHRSITLTSADDWTGVFGRLPRKAPNDHVYRWSVRGKRVSRYSTSKAIARNGEAKLIYSYGSGTAEEKRIAPLVGDPLLLGGMTQIGFAQWASMMLESTAAAAVNGELADSVRTGNEAAPIDFSTLNAINPDICAWISLDGTPIDYPIVRGTDNAYYLNRLYNREVNRAGALFVDSACGRRFADRNTVIYGHHMSDGAMFASLLSYKQQSFYDAHPTMRLYTPDGSYTLELFAAFETSDDYEAVARLRFTNGTDFSAYVNACIRKSDFTAEGVTVAADERIVTLVTCSNAYDHTRYLVMGKLVAVEP